MRRIRVLAFAEAVTLAHVARPAALLRQLDARRYDSVLACDPRYASFVADGPWKPATLTSLPSAVFLRALAQGRPVHTLAGLRAQLAEDLALIAEHQPDVIVGDFRLSLSVSARLARVPYLGISNAYWSPASPQPFPLPVLPMTRWLPIPLARALFQMFGAAAMAGHCQALNRLRQDNGLATLGPSLRRVYTDADVVLVADAPALFPLQPLPADHAYVGPLAWAPPVPLPSWWNTLREDPPAVYVALGSSGAATMLPPVLAALADLQVQVLLSTAGAAQPADLPPNVLAAPYLPGDAAAARARLVVCNGGSMAVQQALAAGVPVLGIASNMDQFMNMAAIERAGAGVLVRGDRLHREALRALCARMLDSPALQRAAQAAGQLQQMPQPAAEVFDAAVTRLLRQKSVSGDAGGSSTPACGNW